MSSSKIHTSITEWLVQAQSESPEVQLQALQALSYLTKVSPQNRNLVAHTHEAISTFISLSKSSPTQTLSLSILFNLSLNPNLRHSLAKSDTIHLLNSIIISPSSPESGKLAASLICSLAMLDKNKALFGVTGTVQKLVESLRCGRTSTAHHLLSSLAELVQFHGNCSLAVRAGGVPALIEVVRSTDGEDLAGVSLLILGLLARFKEGNEAIRRSEGVVGLMVEVLKRRCTMSREGSAEVLVRLFERDEGCVKEAAALPEFSSLVADLLVRGSAKAREKATALMRSMMEANMDCYMQGNPMVLHL